MSAFPIQTGFWFDYTREGVYSGTLTLSTRWSGFLLAALVTYIGIVSTSFWSLLSFTLHQLRVKRGEEDGLYFQQQVILRNSGSPLQAVAQFLRASWAWRAQRSRRLSPRRLKSRALFAALPPFLVFIGFTAAGILVGDMTRPGYGSDNLKIYPANCGLLTMNSDTPESFSASSQRNSKNLQAAKVYMRECYETTAASPACGVYPQKKLPFAQANVSCPFGKDSKGNSLCIVDSAFNLDTGLLDSNSFLGINAAPENRILFRRSSTCSPINATEYAKPRNQPRTDNYTTWDFYFGPIDLSIRPEVPMTTDLPNSTYAFDTSIMRFQIPYRLHPFSDEIAWKPIEPLSVPNASTTLLLLESNTMGYRLPVKDPWFSANLLPPPAVLAEVSSASHASYYADSYVSAMACIDQYQVCNPATSPFTCTILGRFAELRSAWSQMNLNEFQVAALIPVMAAMPTSTTFWITTNLGMAPLLAQELVNDIISPGLPENQWQLECQSWFKTGLAYLQASVLAHPMQPTDLDPGTEFIPVNSSSRFERHICANIRIKNTGGYQSFSTLGLVIILAIGTPIIMLSLTAEPCVAALRMRRRLQHRRLHNKEAPDGFKNDGSVEENVSQSDRSDYREIARIADCVLQLQRKVLTSAAPEVDWEAKMQIVPVTADPAARFTQPRRVKAESKNMSVEDVDIEDDYGYRRAEEDVATQEVTSKIDDDPSEGLLQQPEREIEAEAEAEAEAEDEEARRFNISSQH